MIETVAGFSVLDFLCPIDGKIRALICTCGEEFTHRLNVIDVDDDDDDDHIVLSVSKIRRYTNSRSQFQFLLDEHLRFGSYV